MRQKKKSEKIHFFVAAESECQNSNSTEFLTISQPTNGLNIKILKIVCVNNKISCIFEYIDFTMARVIRKQKEEIQ